MVGYVRRRAPVARLACSRGAGQRGVALALLLWFIAALALLVAGLALVAKTDIRYTRLQMERAQVQALGDGAALALLAGAKAQSRSHLHYRLDFAGREVSIQLVPAVGLIGLDTATETTLALLFELAGGLDRSRAADLAQSVIKWRTQLAERQAGQSGRSSPGVVEDLMSVPGVSRELYQRVAPLVHLRDTAVNGIDTNWSPPAVLRVLATGDGNLEALWQERDLQGEDADMLDNAARFYQGISRADVRVKADSGHVFQRSVWVRPNGNTMLGWEIVQRLPVVAAPSLTFED